MTFVPTTSQTVGPYFAIGLESLYINDLTGPGISGERIVVTGRVIDSAGQPVPDAVIETWQANSHGKYPDAADIQNKPVEPGFRGFARIPTDKQGCFRLTTIKPGQTPAPEEGLQAPHLAVTIFMRGLLRHLVTRIYFADERSNESDPVLKLVPQSRRNTLLARNAGENVYEWNIDFRQATETVFFGC